MEVMYAVAILALNCPERPRRHGKAVRLGI